MDKACVKVDANHFALFFNDADYSDGIAQVFTINTSTFAVTTASTAFTFDATGAGYPQFIDCVQVTSDGSDSVFLVI